MKQKENSKNKGQLKKTVKFRKINNKTKANFKRG
jgi:hypothetical protein